MTGSIRGKKGVAGVSKENVRNSLQVKLRDINDLATISAKERAAGRSVVMAHGVFDLLHIGHLRHLREARREGDLLIVTITADAFVNKGPGRPVFPEGMRAEMLAALDCVDYVGVHREKQAVGALERIRPSVYAKGQDYANAGDDITGGITMERNAVERHGGRVVFTNEAMFSSSSLINRHLSVFDPVLDEYLEARRETELLPQLVNLIDQVKDLRVLMIGDAIIDDYNYVSAIGKSPKEHIIATKFWDREVFAGGVFAAANHVASICRQVDVVTTVGAGCEFAEEIRRSIKPNVTLHCHERVGKPTTRKVRWIDKSYLRKMFEVYHIDDTETEPAIESNIVDFLGDVAADYDVVIIADFGHGLITRRMADVIEGKSRFLTINTQSNSGNMGFNLITKYHRADYVCIDAPEARLAVADRQSSIEHIAGEALPSRIACSRIMVTQGRDGCIGYQEGQPLVHVPAFTTNVVDTVGAGDAFFAVTAPLAAVGASIDQLAFVGNAAGAIKVGIVGHRSSVERVPLLKYLTTLLK
jgi:rfaE bifunctional protein nucleotidyltransferase chain/domain